MWRLITYLIKFWQIQWSNKKYLVKCLALCLIISNYCKPLLLITTKDIIFRILSLLKLFNLTYQVDNIIFSSKEKAIKNISQGHFPSKLLLSLLNPSSLSS